MILFGYYIIVFGSDMILFGSDMILFGSSFKLQEPSVMLVAGFINFGVTNQVPQVSFKIVAGDLISLHFFRYDMNLFRSDLFSDLIIIDSGFKIQELSILRITGFINFGVTNQALQVSNFVVEDPMLVLSYDFDYIIFYEILVIYEAISYY